MAKAQDFIDAGFNPWVAEALEGKELELEPVLTLMSPEEILDEVFAWHGMQGFTRSIIDAVDNVRNMEAL